MHWAMRWGQGVLLGAVRGLIDERGLRGPVGSSGFMNLRLLKAQTLENATDGGAPPWTWPVDEQAVDFLHKAIYAFATGTVADRLVASPVGVPEPRRRWTVRWSGEGPGSLAVQPTGEQEAKNGEARGAGEAYGGSIFREGAGGRATQDWRRVQGIRHPPSPQPGGLAPAAQQLGAEDEVPNAQGTVGLVPWAVWGGSNPRVTADPHDGRQPVRCHPGRRHRRKLSPGGRWQKGAKSPEGATRPNGQKYENWVKGREGCEE
jgi:hypothetical protein